MSGAGRLVLGLAATACAPAPTAARAPEPNPDAALYQRVCHSVVAAYRIGARPSAVEVEVPPGEPAQAAARITLVAPHIPLAEQCLGMAMPTFAEAVRPAASQAPAEASHATPANPPKRSDDPLSTRQ